MICRFNVNPNPPNSVLFLKATSILFLLNRRSKTVLASPARSGQLLPDKHTRQVRHDRAGWAHHWHGGRPCVPRVAGTLASPEEWRPGVLGANLPRAGRSDE